MGNITKECAFLAMLICRQVVKIVPGIFYNTIDYKHYFLITSNNTKYYRPKPNISFHLRKGNCTMVTEPSKREQRQDISEL